MDWKEFFKPKIAKVAIFVLIIVLIGVPSYVTKCSHIFREGESPCIGPYFAFYGLLLTPPLLMDGPIYTYDFSPFLILIYLTLVYILLSSIFYLHKIRKKEM